MKITNQEAEEIIRMHKNVLFFVEKMWGLTPQPIKSEYESFVKMCIDLGEYSRVTVNHFEPFIKYKHITWQQFLILTSYQRALDGKDKKEIAVVSGHGVGKAISNTSKIFKIENNKIIEVEAQTIKPGDTILGNTSPTKVLKVHPQKKQEAYRVTFDDNSKINVLGPHLWAVRGRKHRRNKKHVTEYDVMTTQELLINGVKRDNGESKARQWEIPRMVIDGFKKEKDAYIIGAWYGDGVINSSKFIEKERKIVNYFRSLGWDIHSNETQHVIHGLITVLKEKGIAYNDKTYLPKDFLSWDITSRKELLAGLLDTDGTIGSKNRNIEFGTIRQELAKDTLKLIRSLGGKGRIRIKNEPYFFYKGEKRTGKKYYRVSFQTPFNPFKIDTFNLDRWEKPQERYLSRWMDKIERIDDMDGVCFEVDNPNHLFIAGEDMIVTHNSASMSWIIFHFLFSYRNANIACTAPSKEQMFGVLWKEASLWHMRMSNVKIKSWFKITSDRIVVKGREKHWFANAKTASKDKPEALSGVHSDNVLLLVDEASAVDDLIYENAMGSLTNENYVFIMISNGTKDNGLFYRAHNSIEESKMYQHLQFSSEDSPVVKKAFCEKTLMKAGGDRDNDLYRVRVLGLFPRKGSMDNKNWYRLLHTSSLNEINDERFYEWDVASTTLGIDPSGRGQDDTVWVLRDKFRAKKIGCEKISNEISIARKTWAFLHYYNVVGCQIVIDNFGIGANIGMAILNMTNIPNFGQFINGVNVGDPVVNQSLKRKFFNNKAYLYDVMARWCMAGGEIVKDNSFIDEMTALLYTFEDKEVIRMISKKVLKTEGIASPNTWDAMMLTFKGYDTAMLENMSVHQKHASNTNPLLNKPKHSNIDSEDYLNDYL